MALEQENKIGIFCQNDDLLIFGSKKNLGVICITESNLPQCFR